MIYGILNMILAFGWLTMAIFNKEPSRTSYATAATCAALGCLALAMRSFGGC